MLWKPRLRFWKASLCSQASRSQIDRRLFISRGIRTPRESGCARGVSATALSARAPGGNRDTWSGLPIVWMQNSTTPRVDLAPRVLHVLLPLKLTNMTRKTLANHVPVSAPQLRTGGAELACLIFYGILERIWT